MEMPKMVVVPDPLQEVDWGQINVMSYIQQQTMHTMFINATANSMWYMCMWYMSSSMQLIHCQSGAFVGDIKDIIEQLGWRLYWHSKHMDARILRFIVHGKSFHSIEESHIHLREKMTELERDEKFMQIWI